MNLYFFTFDIDDSSSGVIKQLQQMGNTCSCLSNGWFIRTDKGEDELYDAIQPFVVIVGFVTFSCCFCFYKYSFDNSFFFVVGKTKICL